MLDTTKQETSFEDWMSVVDAYLTAKTGLSHLDFETVDYAALYEEGRSPRFASNAAVRESRK